MTEACQILEWLDALTGGKKDRASRFVITLGINEGPWEGAVEPPPENVVVTVTRSTRLNAFGLGIQGYKEGMPEPFETGLIVSLEGKLVDGGKTQLPTVYNPTPQMGENDFPFQDGDLDGQAALNRDMEWAIRSAVERGKPVPRAQSASFSALEYFSRMRITGRPDR